MTKKKRTAAQFFDDAETHGLEPLMKTDLNSNKVSKHLESGTETNYNRMLVLWDEYEKRNPEATAYERKTAKHFMEGVVRGCCAGKKEPSMYTILQKWTDFGAGWKRRPGNDKIPPEVSESIYFVQVWTFDYSTNPALYDGESLRHVIKNMWKKDWHQYRYGRILVQDHAAYMLFIYSSARVGDYFESNMRKGSGRGLLYETIDFVVFKNEKGKAEIGVRVTRDAKGFSETPHKRPQHGMYEDMEPLLVNPILPLLAIALADRAFQDYATFAEIEAIPPPADGSLHHLRIKKEILRVPFFQIVSVDRPTGKIQGAGSFSNRTVDLGHRAGYEENIGIHDIRREALVKADDNGYSISERMKFAGHNNADTFFGSYAPELSTVDGMASYWNKKRRTIHLEGFRGLSLHHHPQLLQSLPSKVEADLDNCSEFISINKEIDILGEKLR
ncbi:hypothetical protein MMC21_005940 [Puttea exsequens]|nr:hypothetical protein [Puttea exsequens]